MSAGCGGEVGPPKEHRIDPDEVVRLKSAALARRRRRFRLRSLSLSAAHHL